MENSTPKQKAKDLAWSFAYKVDTFHDGDLPGKKAKECALICVDEILKSNPHDFITKGGHDCRGEWSYKEAVSNMKYWQEVKSEIEKL